jgi:septum formation protein
MKHRVILASQSPRRRELMGLLGIDFEVVAPPEDVDLPPGTTTQEILSEKEPESLVTARALAKAQAVAARIPEAVVVGADTVVALDGKVFGKPRDSEHASEMLRALSGRTHLVASGVAVVRARPEPLTLSGVATAQVRFRTLSDSEISAYLETGEPLDKAGAYGIQGRGGILVDRIEGCYFSVVGLPMATLAQLLRRSGVRILGEPA